MAIFCYHLKDWIRNDESVERHVSDDVEPFVTGTRSLGLAGDIANGAKHLARNRQARVDAATRIDVSPDDASQSGFRVVISGESTTYDARTVAAECMEARERF